MGPLDEYPSLPEKPPAVGSLPAEELQRVIRSARPWVDDAAVTDGIRGLRLEVNDSRLYAVGVQTTALSTATTAWAGDTFACQVPVRTLEPAAKGLTGDVEVGWSDGMIGVSDTQRAVTLRTFAGQFMQWNRLLRQPTDDAGSITVNRADLLAAVKRAAIISVDAPLWLTIRDDSLEVASGAETGDFGDVIDVDVAGEPPEAVAFMVHLLTSALSASDAERVTIGFTTAHKPAMFRPSDGKSMQVVMPRRAER